MHSIHFQKDPLRSFMIIRRLVRSFYLSIYSQNLPCLMGLGHDIVLIILRIAVITIDGPAIVFVVVFFVAVAVAVGV